MANEIVETHNVEVVNGNLKHTFKSGQIKTDQTTAGMYDVVHDVDETTEEAITSFGDIPDANKGVVILHNTDGTNYVQYGFATGVYYLRLDPKEVHRVRMDGDKDLYLKADTANCNVRVICHRD